MFAMHLALPMRRQGVKRVDVEAPLCNTNLNVMPKPGAIGRSQVCTLNTDNNMYTIKFITFNYNLKTKLNLKFYSTLFRWKRKIGCRRNTLFVLGREMVTNLWSSVLG